MYSTAMSRLTSIGTITLSLMLFVAERMLFRALACAVARTERRVLHRQPSVQVCVTLSTIYTAYWIWNEHTSPQSVCCEAKGPAVCFGVRKRRRLRSCNPQGIEHPTLTTVSHDEWQMKPAEHTKKLRADQVQPISWYYLYTSPDASASVPSLNAQRPWHVYCWSTSPCQKKTGNINIHSTTSITCAPPRTNLFPTRKLPLGSIQG